MDKDGDLDAVLATPYAGDAYYYKNIGTKEHPAYERYNDTDPNIYWYSNAGKARVVFADVDDDGDLDALVGMERSDEGPTDVDDDVLYFYRNIATSPTDIPQFQYDGSGTNPFAGIHFKKQGWPAFSDYDGDGDLDLAVAGEYDDKTNGKTAWVQFFRNDKPDHASGVDVNYTPLQSEAVNPLYIGESPTAGFYDITFADLDGDGDEDFFATDQHGQVQYKRNDGDGVFVDQEGDYTYAANGASGGNPLNIDGIVLTTPDTYKSLSFGDLDGDGDTDLLLGTNNVGTLNSRYIYVENTDNGVMVVDHSFSNPISGFSMGRNTNALFFDCDNDGDADLLTTGVLSEPDGSEGGQKDVAAHLFFENNNGEFDVKTLLDDPFAALVYNDANGNWVTADVDGDSDIDALFMYAVYDPEVFNNVIVIDYHRNDAGTFVTVDPAESPFKPVTDLNYYNIQMDIGDINADGLPDIVLLGVGDVPKFFKNTGVVGSPIFEPTPAWRDGLITEVNLNPKLVDVDADGDTDLVLGKYFYLWYYENIGTPTTPKWKEYQEQDEGQNLQNPFGAVAIFGGGEMMPEVADVDGDGDKDLFVGKQSDGTFFFYENQNPTPVVTTNGSTHLELVVNKGLVLDPGMTIADPDNDNIVKISVAIAPYEQGIEKLQVPAASSYPNLVISWDDDKGVLTIAGKSSITDFQGALQDVEYLYTGPDGGGRKSKPNAARTLSKTVTITTLDSDQTVGSTNTTTFNIGHSNLAPVISPTAFNATFTSVEIPVFPSIVLSDDDDADLSSATVTFDSSYKPAEDRLTMNLTGNIGPAFNQTTGVLTLTGPGTVAQYEAVLRAVMYSNVNGPAGTPGIRVLNVKVNDGEADSNVGSTQLSVNGAVNNPPTITGGTVSPFYVSGDLVINNSINVSDADGVILSATIAIAPGFTSTEDILLFDNQNGITGSYSSTTGILTLSGSSSVANYQAALRSVKYRNASPTPTTNDRGITFTVTDGSTPASLAGTVIVINKPPDIKTVTKKTAATDGNVAFPVSAITDPDNNLDISSLLVTSEKGAVTIEDGIITIDYAGNGDRKGTDHITITVCDTGGRCKTQNIDVELGALAVIYNAFSPNGDGINDWFYIENLPDKTHVVIYDRWGDPIFESEDYDMSEPAGRFDGKNKNGVDVVAGTYYYKVKFDDDTNGTRTGYIILNR